MRTSAEWPGEWGCGVFMSNRPELLRRVQEYCEKNGLIPGSPLGSGVHGIVFAVESQTEKGKSAIKVHERERDYRRERDVYLRLVEREVTDIRGCAIPELLHHDDDLWILAMTIVTRPFVLDFAGAYLDQAPDFSKEVLADWRTEKEEQFGPRWPEVQAILRFLEGYGVFMLDVNPGNISFGD
jgi:hypothetical protein